MAGTLQRLKDKLKRWNSFQRRLPSAAAAPSSSVEAWKQSPASSDKRSAGLHLVYVGKSRRRYLVSSDVIGHPLFQVLAQRSGVWDGCGGAVMGCEVVLFEHLLWLLQNAELQPDAIDELAEYYAT